jgi:hypothetical protein
MNNNDLVSQMVQHMGLTPQMADQLQSQAQMPGNYPVGYSNPSVAGPGLPSTPEEQMRLMEAAQNPAQAERLIGYQPQEMPMEDTESSESSASTASDVDLEKVGLNSAPKSTLDTVMDYLRDPLVIIVLFIIINLSQVSDLIKKFMPPVIASNLYYLLGIKAVIMGVTFLVTKMVIS